MNERAERWERRFEIPVLVAALLVIPVIAIEQSEAREPWRTLASALNWLIWLVFAAELVVMLAVVPNRWAWLRRHPLDVAIVVLTPPFVPASLQVARVLRLLRLLRVVRAVRIARRLFSLEGVRYGAVLAVMVALGGGATFAAVEGKSTWEGVYWAVTTMTTVGYGDITPKTDSGRVIAMGVMVVGIGFLSLVIGAVAERFLATEVAEVEEEVAGAEADVLRELAEIATRLRRIEANVRQLQRR